MCNGFFILFNWVVRVMMQVLILISEFDIEIMQESIYSDVVG